MLTTFDSSLSINKSYFNNNGLQNYSIFQPIFQTFSNEEINPYYTTNHNIFPKIVLMNNSGKRF